MPKPAPEVGAHFFIGIPGPDLDPPTRALLRTVRPGGVILFGRNVRTAARLARLTARLRDLLGEDLLVCLDHEGGRVNRLKDLTGAVPSAPQLAHLGDERFAREHGRLTGRLLREVGVNVNLAPVLDLWLRPGVDNSVPDRCWSHDPRAVARFADAFLRGMQSEGVLGCGKHFLGYGAADKDPHQVLPRVNRSARELEREDLRPYADLWDGGKGPLRMIMLSHAHLRAYHRGRLTPACVSPKLMGGILRQRLGFQGVTITDDLEMGAITRTMTVGEAAVGCLRNGVDLVLICHTAKAIREGHRAAFAAARKGRLTDRLLAESRARLAGLREDLAPAKAFSPRRWEALLGEIRRFAARVFARLPDRLKVMDARWGPIGEE
ncbi:MAG: glycoside hydrolase family 3 protein [Verrucomicrobiae bacterium]|nr:glycoside hydrolase family 3 protein [Verrucomicrobiae bacterium]